MIAFFANIFGYLLNFIYEIVNNYGIAIILFSLLIKLLMLPISKKKKKTMKKSVKIQEKMKEIQFKYKNNPEKLNQETLELYKTENMSPFSGCFSAIAQIILLFAVFYLVRSPLTYMKKVDGGIIEKYTKIINEYKLSENSSYPEIDVIREIDNIKNLNLEQINNEELEQLNINMELFGFNLAQVPLQSSDWKAYIIPILYVIISILSLKIINPTSVSKKELKENEEEKSLTKPEEEIDPTVQLNKNLNKIYPIMYMSVALVAPLGLALYWLVNSLLMIVERLALNKLLKDEEE